VFAPAIKRRRLAAVPEGVLDADQLSTPVSGAVAGLGIEPVRTGVEYGITA